MRKVLYIENLDCPVCAEALQGDLQKIKGVRSVAVDFVSQTISLEYEREEVLTKVVKTTNAFEEVRVKDGGRYALNAETHAVEWIRLVVGAVGFLVGVLLASVASGVPAQICSYVAYAVGYLGVGYPVLLSTIKNIVKGRIFDENFLMTIASLGAIALGEVGEGVAVMVLYQLGELLQSIAVGSSRRSVARLMELKSERAILLKDGEQIEVRPEELRVGDRVLVKAGEKAPADGALLGERAILDMKSLTGEAEPRTVTAGQEVLSGSINAGAAYELEITRPYEESAVGRILNTVENAAASKAKPEKFIAKFSKYYTPIVCGLALLLAVLAPLLNGLIVDGRLHFVDFSRWGKSALTFLVVSCPCALVISVPLTYFSGIGACSKQGILVKGATYLDALARSQTFAFDKTGTLTEGSFSVRRVYGEGEGEILSILAAVEKGSAHPIAKAFEGIKTELVATEIVEVAGEGLLAKIDGEEVVAGNEKLLRAQGIFPPAIESEYTLVYVAKNGAYLGAAEIGDCVKSESKEAIAELKRLGVLRVTMLTGDNAKRAQRIANEVGMDEVNAELLPDEKLRKAEEYKANGGVTYVGDGVNDAPVMTAADCSISMGKLGSAAAVEASDMVLVSDDLNGLPKALAIAKKTRSIVWQNILFSLCMKAGFLALGGWGILSLWFAVFADVGVMLLAVLNSFRVRK